MRQDLSTRRSTAGPCCSGAALFACSGFPSGLGSCSTAGRTALRSGRAVLRSCWRGGWPPAALSTPSRPRARLGPADVTVVVPVRDRPAQLDRLLGSWSEGLACIVVDDASADAGATKEIAERHGAAFIGLAQTSDRPARATPGWLRYTAPLVAFVDSDCVPSDGWLAPLLGHFDDPLVAAVAPRIVARRWRRCRYEASRSSLDRGAEEGPVRPGSRIPFVPSAALVVRTDVATGTRPLRPALRGGEDVDLVWRLSEAGWDVRYVPSSTVAHEGPATLKDFLARRAFYGTTAAPLSRRHGDAAGSAAPLRLVAARLDPAAGPPTRARADRAVGVHRRAGRRLRGLVRDPVGVATQIAGRGTTAFGTARAGLLDAGLGAPLRAGAGLPPDPSRLGSGPSRPRPARVGRRPSERSTRCAPLPSTWPTMSPTAPGSGSVAPGSGPWCRSSRGSPGGPGCGRNRPYGRSDRRPAVRATHTDE